MMRRLSAIVSSPPGGSTRVHVDSELPFTQFDDDGDEEEDENGIVRGADKGRDAMNEASNSNSFLVKQDHVPQHMPSLNGFTLLEQLFFQLLFPASVPFIACFRSINALRNMRFVCTTEQSYVTNFQLLLSAAVWITVGVFLGVELPAIKAGADSGGSSEAATLRRFAFFEAVITLLAAVAQRACVAIKWAYLPRLQYELLMRRRAILKDLQMDQILDGFVDLSSHEGRVLHKELYLAQKRIGADAKKVMFTLPRVHMEALTLLLGPTSSIPADPDLPVPPQPQPPQQQAPPLPQGKEASTEAEPSEDSSTGTTTISAYDLARWLLWWGSQREAKFNARLALALLWICIAIAFLPLIVRVSTGLPAIGDSAAQGAIFVASIFAGIWHPVIFTAYLRVALVDMRRRAATLTLLGQLCSLAPPEALMTAISAQQKQLRAKAASQGLATVAVAPGMRSRSLFSMPKKALSPKPLTEELDAFKQRRSVLIRTHSSLGRLSAAGQAPAPPPGLTMTTEAKSPSSSSAVTAIMMTETKAEPSSRTRTSIEAVASGSGRRDSTVVVVGINPMASAATVAAAAASGATLPPAPASNSGGAVAISASSPSSFSAPQLHGAILPLTHQGNLGAFLVCRRLLSLFALRYSLRLQAYTTLASLMIAVIVVAILVLTFSSSSSATSSAVFGVAAVALSYMLLLLFFVLSMLGQGSAANGTAKEHEALLAARAFEARQAALLALHHTRRSKTKRPSAAAAERAHDSQVAEREWNGLASLADSLAKVILHDGELMPQRIMFVAASYGMLRGVMAAAFSAVIAGLNLLLSQALRGTAGALS